MALDIVGILLAAGQSRRFGSDKLLQSLPGSAQAMAVQSAQRLLEVLPNSIAVVGKDNQALKRLLVSTTIQPVENPNPGLGLSSSIICAIRHAHAADAWVIALADMPYIPSDVIRQVCASLRAGRRLVAPVYEQQRGHPVGVSHHFKAELLHLSGDSGARTVLQRHASELHAIPATSDAILRDIDRPEDICS